VIEEIGDGKAARGVLYADSLDRLVLRSRVEALKMCGAIFFPNIEAIVPKNCGNKLFRNFSVCGVGGYSWRSGLTGPHDLARLRGGIMQVGRVGGIGDFGKFALLRYLMQDRRVAVCWYTACSDDGKTEDCAGHFDYLKRPDQFRHLAPELFDQLANIAEHRRAVTDPLIALQTSGVFDGALFVRQDVPKKPSLRLLWAKGLANSVSGADLVFLNPQTGIQGKRLTTRHVALAEIAALRQKGRVLIIGHRPSGRKAEVKYLADRMKSLGCDVVEIVRLRLATSYLYVILDQDPAMTELAATFVRRWGDLAKSYRF
jgi:hypothetical protein